MNTDNEKASSARPQQAERGWTTRIAHAARNAFWFLMALAFLFPTAQAYWRNSERTQVLKQFQQERKSQVIGLIHRQDTVSLLGLPVTSYISIEDSEAILRVIRRTPPEQPIDVILHTPGGLVLAAEQIAKALADHKGKVTVFVPHYAMSGGTLIALAADEIVMDPNAVLGPVDPQIGQIPAASIVKVLEVKKPDQVNDLTLIVADVARKARIQVTSFVSDLLLKHMPMDKASELALILTDGRWTHDFPITVQQARSLGISVSTDMPRTVYDLMDLYPQAGAGRPSVLYVPLRHGFGTPDESSAGSPAQPSKVK